MKEKQNILDRRYMKMAEIWAENSYCKRRKVGALIVKDKMIISDGYNGTPSGFENICEDETGHTNSYVLHAEANAITKVSRTNNSSEGATLYVTASPCIAERLHFLKKKPQHTILKSFPAPPPPSSDNHHSTFFLCGFAYSAQFI